MNEYLVKIIMNDGKEVEYTFYDTQENAEKRAALRCMAEYPFKEIQSISSSAEFYSTQEEFNEAMIGMPSDLVGVETWHFQHKFGVKHSTIKYMEKKGLLGIVGYRSFKKAGLTLLQPLYDAKYYFLSQEEFSILMNFAYSR